MRKRIENVYVVDGGVVTRCHKIVPRQVNTFIWRLSLDRIPTRFNLSKKGLELLSIGCPVCVESVQHMFFLY